MKQMIAFAFAVALAANVSAENYNLDASHTQVGFKIKHMGLSTVRGTFDGVDATVSYKGSPETLELTATIQVSSVNTKNEKRDGHLANEDYFDAEKFPTIMFKSTGVEKDDEDWVMNGHITIKGVTKPIQLELEVNGPVDSPWQEGTQIIGVVLEGEITRQDFGVAHDGASDKLIGDTVELEINLEASK